MSESGFTGWKDEQNLNMCKKMIIKKADSESINPENLIILRNLIQTYFEKLVNSDKERT